MARDPDLLRISSGLTILHPSSPDHWAYLPLYLRLTIPSILWLPGTFLTSEPRDTTAPPTLVRVPLGLTSQLIVIQFRLSSSGLLSPVPKRGLRSSVWRPRRDNSSSSHPAWSPPSSTFQLRPPFLPGLPWGSSRPQGEGGGGAESEGEARCGGEREEAQGRGEGGEGEEAQGRGAAGQGQ